MPHITFHHDSHQISDSTPLAFMLALTGGYLDAYTYVSRGGVFANAQTGNMVLLGMNIAAGKFSAALTYFIPIIAFAAGVCITEIIRHHFQKAEKIHWRQIIVFIEMGMLAGVALIPESANMAANCLVSFVCAMQVDTFRKWHDHAFATTMCTGNLRTATELMCSSYFNSDKHIALRGAGYYLIIATFIAGAAGGYVLTKLFAITAVLFTLIPLAAGCAIMCIRED